MSEPARIAWEQFTADPRREGGAGMRASDKDRDVALAALGEAFADGRLDRVELDERTGTVQRAKHLGELVAPLSDLAAPEPVTEPGPVTAPLTGRTGGRAPHPDHGPTEPAPHPFAGRWVFLLPAVVCWVIWASAAFEGGGFHPGFPWPLFVMLGTGWMAFGGGCGPVARAGREVRGVRRDARAERRLGRGHL